MSSNNENLAIQRIAKLVDENSFMEIGSLVTARNTDFNLADTDTPSDGVITGYGLIDGNLVYVYSQDASVLNGTIGEMHAKKIANVYDMAMKMGAPVIGFIDCAGMRLQESVDALDGFGRIYAKEIEASGVIPQISAAFVAAVLQLFQLYLISLLWKQPRLRCSSIPQMRSRATELKNAIHPQQNSRAKRQAVLTMPAQRMRSSHRSVS